MAPRLSYRWSLALLTAVGAVARLAWLGRQSIGYDEDFTAVVAHQPLDRMLDIVGRDSAPPLFYLAERAVVALADLVGLAPTGGAGSPFVLRLVPALAGIALIPLVAALGRRVAGDGAAIWAAAIVALAPASVLLSGFARMYAPAAALIVAATVLLWRALERPGPGRWAAYLAAAAAAVWTTYFAALALAGVLVAGLWLRPGRRLAAVASGLTVLAVSTVAPWVLVARSQLEHTGENFWVLPLSPLLLVGTVAQLFTGPAVDLRLPSAPVLIGLQVAAGLAGTACLFAAALAWRRLGAPGRMAAVFCLLASSGVVALAAVSLWRPLLDARYASVMWMPLFALAGVGLAAVARRLALVLVTALAVPALVLSVITTHPETSSLVPDLDAQVGAHDLVAASWDHYLVVLDQGGPRVRDRLHVLSTADLPWYVGTAAYPPGAEIHALPAALAADGGLVFWIADPGVAPPFLPSGYASLRSRCVTLVCLTVYGPGGR